MLLRVQALLFSNIQLVYLNSYYFTIYSQK